MKYTLLSKTNCGGNYYIDNSLGSNVELHSLNEDLSANSCFHNAFWLQTMSFRHYATL